MAHLVLRKNRIVDRQHSATRIAEHMLDVLVGERLNHHLGAGHFPCHAVPFMVVVLSRRNKKGPKRAMSGRFLRPPVYDRISARTATTVIILRHMGIA